MATIGVDEGAPRSLAHDKRVYIAKQAKLAHNTGGAGGVVAELIDLCMIIGESPEPQPPHARVLLYCVAPEAMDGRGRRVRNEISTESDKNLCGALVETNTRLLVRCCPPSGAPKSQLPLLIRPQLFTARAKNRGSALDPHHEERQCSLVSHTI